MLHHTSFYLPVHLNCPLSQYKLACLRGQWAPSSRRTTWLQLARLFPHTVVSTIIVTQCFVSWAITSAEQIPVNTTSEVKGICFATWKTMYTIFSRASVFQQWKNMPFMDKDLPDFLSTRWISQYLIIVWYFISNENVVEFHKFKCLFCS